VDHQVNNPAPSNRPAPIVERQPFGEQLRAFFRRNALVFLVIALIWLIAQDIFGTHGVLAMHRSHQERDKLQTDIQKIDAENKKLQGDVKDLQSDKGMQEKAVREELSLARPGEQVFTTEQRFPPAAAPAPPAPKKHWYFLFLK
jgi:cell division protein FtsB